ncbi:MAG: flagellar hook-basal body complex protein [Deltaproteobacteria bacterium]|jgi:flagellar hook-basal body protein|nr:flagellar hook-basal body complex protein [Deltaproteobacteria bacterium]
MSISAAMYAAVTGLSALSTGMQVISNNIANVNTVGFKAARANFEDLISQDYLSNGRIQQIGRGVKISSVQQMFTQGAFINSAQDTDMAIAGEGFFQVRDRITGDLVYTRAGNFTLDKDGLLETPAGYVLQGWEMSIPKPGADPVKIGVPTDVKVIVLNAPPVETSQIKVVVNLNADDNSAYIYSSAGFAELYADQFARGPAESARVSAANAVFNTASADSSAYLAANSAYTNAYLKFLSAQGFIVDPLNPGTYVRRVNPSATDLAAAQSSASAAAWAALTITNPSYRAASTPPMWASAYNSAYVNWMDLNGFEADPANPGTFIRKTGFSTATAADVAQAVTAGMASAVAAVPGYGGYTTGFAPGDAEYASAYTHSLESIGYVRPVATFTAVPTTPAELAAATAAATASATAWNTAYPGYPGIATLVSAAQYALTLEAAGHKLSSAFAIQTTLPAFSAAADFAAAHTAALTAADPGSTGFSVYDPTDPAYPASMNLAYLASFLNSMSASTELAPAWAATIPTTAIATIPPLAPTSTEYLAAAALGLAAAKLVDTSYAAFPSGPVSTNPAADIAYLKAFAESIEGVLPLGTYVVAPGALPPDAPTLAQFFVSSAAAHAAGLAAAKSVNAAYTAYPSPAGAVDKVADLAYAAAYAKSLAMAGMTLDPGYAGPTGNVVTTAYSDRVPNAADYAAAVAVGEAAANNVTPPITNYGTYPTGDKDRDDAYIAAYEASFPANSTSRLTLHSALTPFKSFTPNPAQLAAANAHATTSARSAVGPFTGFPSTAGDPVMRAAYDAAYRTEMTNLGFDEILPPPTSAPYFYKEQPATAAELATADKAAKAAAELAAKNAGQAAFDKVYEFLFTSAMNAVMGLFPPWQLEGMGFAGAWDGTDLESPIDPENYTHANPWTIYDSLGTAHTLMVYYQPNPYMENVWDYIITCDPTEDARKDLNNSVVMNGSSFAGLIQKGKITFTADGEDRHGGLIKDIEAQNIDMSKTARSVLTSGSASISASNYITASSMNHYTFGGYYTGSPAFSATTGTLVATQRQYNIEWMGNLSSLPPVSGFTWTDDAGNSGTIPVYDKNWTGPYTFGSGLSVSFHKGGTPMRFSVGDTLSVTAQSEELGWTNLVPNEEGYFDFDVAFVQSASMAMHPPYPEGLPTIIQHIALDMGARYTNPGDPDDPYQQRWVLDEQSTTQYATKSLNIFSSQDGYPPGSLQRISIGADGILTGIYTNGRHQPLYQIGLTRFLNPWGLAKLGDNVYMETRWSGTGVINPPGYGGTGTIRANFLEQSNTDLADEIVNMIVTQRGFQANSKVVTTTDTMLAEVIEMKR